MKIRFSDKSQKIQKSVDNFFNLNFIGSLEFIVYYNSSLNIKQDILKDELMIFKNYLNSQIKCWTILDMLSIVTMD